MADLILPDLAHPGDPQHAADHNLIVDAIKALDTRTTVHSNDYVNVRDYGVIGDGVADDTPAIQALLNSKQTLFFPEGVYVINQALVFKSSGQSLIGVGSASVIKLRDGRTQNVDMLTADTLSGITITRMKIDGNIVGNPGAPSSTALTTCIHIRNGSHHRIIDVEVVGGNIEGIYLGSVSQTMVANVVASDNGLFRQDASGLHLDGAWECTISNVIAQRNGFHGIILTASTKIALSTVVCDDNGWNGIMLQYGCTFVTMASVQASGNFRGVYFRDWTDMCSVSAVVANANATSGVILDNGTRISVDNLVADGNSEYGVDLKGQYDTLILGHARFNANALGTTHQDFPQPDAWIKDTDTSVTTLDGLDDVATAGGVTGNVLALAAGGIWQPSAQVAGPQGPVGPQGPPGAQGAQGIPGYTGFYNYLWNNSGGAADPGSGHLSVRNDGGQNRTLAISETDNTGALRNLGLVQVGDNITLTDNPVSGPVTVFSRYVVTNVGTDQGTFWTIPMTRTDGAGNFNPGANNTPLRVVASFASIAPMTLDQLSDVTSPTAANNDVLTFDTATSQWKPKAVAAGSPFILNVRDYGAKGDGTTDDTTAIKAAIAAAPSGTFNFGYTVYFPRGTYLISSALTMPRQQMTYRGDAMDASVIKAKYGSAAFTMLDGSTGGLVRDLTFDGDYTTGVKGVGGSTGIGANVMNVKVMNCPAQGLNVDAAIVQNVWVQECGTGIKAEVNVMHMSHIRVQTCSVSGIEVRSAARINDVVISECPIGINMYSAANAIVSNATISNCTTAAMYFVSYEGVLVSNVMMRSNPDGLLFAAFGAQAMGASVVNVSSRFISGTAVKLSNVNDNVKLYGLVHDGNGVPTVAGTGKLVALGIGAWTEYYPAVTAAAGTITTATCIARWSRVGRTVTLSVRISITTNGTGANAVQTVLPFPAQAGGTMWFVGIGKEINMTGALCNCWIDVAAPTILKIRTYNDGYPGQNSAIIYASIVYEAATDL